jgi:hypothetical protein
MSRTINTELVWSLGKFSPKLPACGGEPHDDDVAAAFLDFLSERIEFTNERDSIHVRPPWHMWSCWTDPEQGGSSEWHRDEGSYDYMIVWANRRGTEITPDVGDRVYTPQDGEVLLFNNMQMFHRSPTVLKPHAPVWRYRWFCRTFLNGTTKLRDVPDVRPFVLDNSLSGR